MKSNIFIPKIINVGYQERKGTYTGKLAYIIYYDEKGKLRKETSWNGWRDNNIPNEEFENVPTSGFVLNKKVGDYKSEWNHRQAYCRVYDPRDFEFEITIENLLYILENTNSIKGKGLEGEFVYGWSGKDMILMPVESPDYKEIQKYNDIVHSNKTIKVKDLTIGATYLDKDNIEFIYMGKFDKYDFGYWKNENFFSTRNKMIKWCVENNIPKTKNKYCFGYREEYKEDRCGMGNVGKQHCFYYKRKTYSGEYVDDFYWIKSLGQKFIDVVNDKCCENYADLFYVLEGTDAYSPIDESMNRYFPMSFEEFYNKATYKKADGSVGYQNIIFKANYNGEYKKYYIKNSYLSGKYIVFRFSNDNMCYGDIELTDVFPTKEIEVENGYFNTHNKVNTHMIPVSLETIYETLKPVYKQIYLKNGREYKRIYTL